jgi:hypothetical protein
VRSAVGELEAIVAAMMGVGVPGASVKEWRRRLAATTTQQQLAEVRGVGGATRVEAAAALLPAPAPALCALLWPVPSCGP